MIDIFGESGAPISLRGASSDATNAMKISRSLQMNFVLCATRRKSVVSAGHGIGRSKTHNSRELEPAAHVQTRSIPCGTAMLQITDGTGFPWISYNVKKSQVYFMSR